MPPLVKASHYGLPFFKMKLTLSGLENKVLYLKYKGMGLTDEQASKRLNSLKLKLRNLVFDLKNKNKSEEFINQKFKEEFEKECMKF